MSQGVRAFDSPRWCATCNDFGDHHTDRHEAPIPAGSANHNASTEKPGEAQSTTDANHNTNAPVAALSGHSEVSHDLTAAGDLMQSAASRVTTHVLDRKLLLPYEVHMAVLELRDAINAWTDARSRS